MEYTRFGKIYFFETQLSNDELQKFINGEIDGQYLRDEIIEKPSLSYTDKFYLDMEFGQKLINEFLIDNRNSPKSFTPQESIMLLKKFENVKELCYLGDIKSVKLLLPFLEVDEIFTQQRKNKYIEMVQTHLEY